jgi:hypothetical protein
MNEENKKLTLDLIGLCQDSIRTSSEARLLTLRIHDALIKARVPGYIQAFDGHLTPDKASNRSLRLRLQRQFSKFAKVFGRQNGK